MHILTQNSFLFLFLTVYSSTFVPVFSLLPILPSPFLSPASIPLIAHVHGSFIHVLCLFPSLSPSFHQSLHPTSPPTAISLFHVSVSLVLFFSLVCFIHQIPIISEVICYFSFTDRLILLSIIVSSSIHAVAKGRTSFFLLHSIPLCKCTTIF